MKFALNYAKKQVLKHSSLKHAVLLLIQNLKQIYRGVQTAVLM